MKHASTATNDFRSVVDDIVSQFADMDILPVHTPRGDLLTYPI